MEEDFKRRGEVNMHLLESEWPILQAIIPLFASLSVLVLRGWRYSRILSIVLVFICFSINIYGLFLCNNEVRYNLGGFSAPIGIEYRLDSLNQPIISFVSAVLLFVLIMKNYLKQQIEIHIEKSKISFFYGLLLLAYTGICGILSTNDLFNLYVFLEIFTLSSYALISQTGDRRAVVGALEYLILGTIGASLILIAIGMIFSLTGSLNIDDIHLRLGGLYKSRVLLLGLVFFIVGCLLKIALMPLHVWMIRAYSFASPILLTFLGAVSSLVGLYILIRFIYFVVDSEILYDNYFGEIMKYLGMSAAVVGSYFAYKSESFRTTILYSATAQIGYACLMLIEPSPTMAAVALLCVISDSITKLSLFATSSAIEANHNTHLKTWHKRDIMFLLFVSIILLSNASMPFTLGFVCKINILSELLNLNEYALFFGVIVTSVISFEYNYKIFKALFVLDRNFTVTDTIYVGIPAIASTAVLIYSGRVIEFFSNFFMSISSYG